LRERCVRSIVRTRSDRSWVVDLTPLAAIAEPGGAHVAQSRLKHFVTPPPGFRSLARDGPPTSCAFISSTCSARPGVSRQAELVAKVAATPVWLRHRHALERLRAR
jgi:hypothetical protein